MIWRRARLYDSFLGRWHSVDPLIDGYPGYSPYCYTGDDPINKVDPDGRFWGAIIGAAAEYVSQSIESGDWSPGSKSWSKIGVSAAAGLVSGGTSIIAKVAIGTATSVAEGMIKNAIDGKDLTDDLAANFVSGSLGSAGGALLEKTVKNTVDDVIDEGYKTMNKGLNRTRLSEDILQKTKKSKVIKKHTGKVQEGKSFTSKGSKKVNKGNLLYSLEVDDAAGSSAKGAANVTNTIVKKASKDEKDKEEN